MVRSAMSLTVGLVAGLGSAPRAPGVMPTAFAVEPAVEVRPIVVGGDAGSYAWMMPHEGAPAVERGSSVSTPRSRDLAALSSRSADAAIAQRDPVALAFAAGLALGAAGVDDASRAKVVARSRQASSEYAPDVASALELAATRLERGDACEDCLAAVFRACATTENLRRPAHAALAAGMWSASLLLTVERHGNVERHRSIGTMLSTVLASEVGDARGRRLASGMSRLVGFVDEAPRSRGVYAVVAAMAEPAPR